MVNLLRNVLASLFRRPATRLYPAEARAPFPGARGRLELDPDACSYCGVCQKKCPASAILVSRAPRAWTLEAHRCILCGACVEACPKHALSFDPHHRPPAV